MKANETRSSVRFDLEVGTPYKGELGMSAPVGCGVRCEGSDHTELRFWSLPRLTFYLKRSESKREGSQPKAEIKYTLYARKCARNGSVAFENPVGHGQITEALPGYIEIFFRFPRDRVFLSLHPSGHDAHSQGFVE